MTCLFFFLGTESPYPQDGERSSFTTGKISLYVTNERFSEILGWILMNTNKDTLGKNLDFILHPCFGCNFADHQMWSMHRGTRVPNNMYGIAQSGDWTGIGPPAIDPLGPSIVSMPCQATLDDILSYEVHFLYDPTNENHTVLIQDIKIRFKSYFGDFVGELYPTDVEFDQFESNFIASDAKFLVLTDVIGEVISWIALNVPTSKMLSVCVHPIVYQLHYDKCDKVEYSLWLGQKFPLKSTLGLENKIPKLNLPNQDKNNKIPKVTNDFILYISRAPNNPWQAEAWNKIIFGFESFFSNEMEICKDSNPNPEPNYSNYSICVMDESLQPYKNDADIMTTTYKAYYISSDFLEFVFPWIILNKSKGINGYSVDVMLVQLTQNIQFDYIEQTFYSGTKWSMNTALIDDPAIRDEKKKNVGLNANQQEWPDLSPSVRYYKEENVDSIEVDPESGIVLRKWIPSDTDLGDWTISPPFITSLTIPGNTKSLGDWESFWLPADAYFVIIEGK